MAVPYRLFCIALDYPQGFECLKRLEQLERSGALKRLELERLRGWLVIFEI